MLRNQFDYESDHDYGEEAYDQTSDGYSFFDVEDDDDEEYAEDDEDPHEPGESSKCSYWVGLLRGSIDPLDKEEEDKLIARGNAGDEAAMYRLLQAHIRLISNIANKHLGSSVDRHYFNDLMSIGVVALYHTVSMGQPQTSLAARAYQAIYFDMQKFLIADKREVRLQREDGTVYHPERKDSFHRPRQTPEEIIAELDREEQNKPKPAPLAGADRSRQEFNVEAAIRGMFGGQTLEIVTLRWVYGMPVRKIAVQMGLSTSQIYRVLADAKEVFTAYMERRGMYTDAIEILKLED